MTINTKEGRELTFEHDLDDCTLSELLAQLKNKTYARCVEIINLYIN